MALNPYKKAAKKPFNLKVSNLSPSKERKIVVNPYRMPSGGDMAAAHP